MEGMDYLVRATAAQGSVRAFALRTTELTNEAQRRHDLYPVASAALGRTMAVALVMGSMMKGSEHLTIQIQSKGLLRGLVVSSDSQGRVRGYVRNPHVQLPLNSSGKLAVGEAVGSGVMHIIRDMGMREPYQGTVQLQTGEIGEDFAYYFAVSEQTPSVVSVGTLVNPNGSIKASGGYVLQLLPDADDKLVAELEERIPHTPSVTNLLDAGRTPEDILHLLLGDKDLNIHERVPVRYHCPCSIERFRSGLITLGREELETLAEEEDQLELVCHFCQERYYVSRDEVLQLMAELDDDSLEKPQGE